MPQPKLAPDTTAAAVAMNDSAKDASAIPLAAPEQSPAYFNVALKDAERLLKYAAESGVDVDTTTRDHVLKARTAGTKWDEGTTANLLAALTKLAAQLKPVTAESLKACEEGTGSTVHTYWIVAACLALIIVPFSIISFVSTAISTAIRTDISTANELAVKLRAQLGPPVQVDSASPSAASNTAGPLPQGLNETDVITELQQFASIIRAVDNRARQLNFLLFHIERDPFSAIRKDSVAIHNKLQLPTGLLNYASAASDRTFVYQDVRYFAQSALDDISFYYGAFTTCVLPVLYALLGTCAYLLRSFEQQLATHTFTPSVADSARFLIAGICGAVVGLFNNFTITQGVSVPPLAFAFLLGYAVDVFFSFLEGLLQSFTKTKGKNTSMTSAAGSSA